MPNYYSQDSLINNLRNQADKAYTRSNTALMSIPEMMAKEAQQNIENARQEELMGFKRNAEQRLIAEDAAKKAFSARIANPDISAFDTTGLRTADNMVQKAVAGKDFVPTNADEYNKALLAERAGGPVVDNKLFGMEDSGLDANKMNALYGDARLMPRLDPEKFKGFIASAGREERIAPKDIAAELAVQKAMMPEKVDNPILEAYNKEYAKQQARLDQGGSVTGSGGSSKTKTTKSGLTVWDTDAQIEKMNLSPSVFGIGIKYDTDKAKEFVRRNAELGYTPATTMKALKNAYDAGMFGDTIDWSKADTLLASYGKDNVANKSTGGGGLLGGTSTTKPDGQKAALAAIVEQYPELLGKAGQTATIPEKKDSSSGSGTVAIDYKDSRTPKRSVEGVADSLLINEGGVLTKTGTDKNSDGKDVGKIIGNSYNYTKKSDAEIRNDFKAAGIPDDKINAAIGTGEKGRGDIELTQKEADSLSRVAYEKHGTSKAKGILADYDGSGPLIQEIAADMAYRGDLKKNDTKMPYRSRLIEALNSNDVNKVFEEVQKDDVPNTVKKRLRNILTTERTLDMTGGSDKEIVSKEAGDYLSRAISASDAGSDLPPLKRDKELTDFLAQTPLTKVKEADQATLTAMEKQDAPLEDMSFTFVPGGLLGKGVIKFGGKQLSKAGTALIDKLVGRVRGKDFVTKAGTITQQAKRGDLEAKLTQEVGAIIAQKLTPDGIKRLLDIAKKNSKMEKPIREFLATKGF